MKDGHIGLMTQAARAATQVIAESFRLTSRACSVWAGSITRTIAR